MAHALSDDQVAGELKKMKAFIHQEASEKAREIRIKADEEFAIEKSKLVRAETSSIDALYERKFKQAELSQQIARSNVTNKIRLKVLAAQQELLDKIFEETAEKLKKTSDSAEYKDILKNLVLEGLFALMETKLVVRVRSKDLETARGAVEEAVVKYKEEIGVEVEVKIDEENPLPEESSGGVFILGTNGKITINNTLDERLKLIEYDSLPAVRASVFGENPNRKFYD